MQGAGRLPLPSANSVCSHGLLLINRAYHIASDCLCQAEILFTGCTCQARKQPSVGGCEEGSGESYPLE